MEASNFKGVATMTATDHIESTLYQQREREMNLRNERRRVALERQALSPTVRTSGSRRGLAHALRSRLTALVTGVPARG
jgi:hypothetical protein